MSRLRAGGAPSAILLRATGLDLAVVPCTQAVKVDATRQRLQEKVLSFGRGLQLMLRVCLGGQDFRSRGKAIWHRVSGPI
jgi:hypothetical protein